MRVRLLVEGKPTVILKSLLVLAVASGGIVAGVAQASAADAIAAPEEARWSWSGCYVGANVGYIRGDD